MTTTNYPQRYDDLQEMIGKLAESAPGPMAKFSELHRAALAPGALDQKTKELIALAIGIAGHCDGCIAYHVHDGLMAGATEEEIAETIGVAVLMGGGPSVVYGAEAHHALEQFLATPAAVSA